MTHWARQVHRAFSLFLAPFVLFSHLGKNSLTTLLWLARRSLTCSSSAGVKSFLMLKVFLISSGVLPGEMSQIKY